MTLSTADPAEIARFDALATTWWQPDGPMWPLHRLNALRTPYIVERLCASLNRSPNGPAPLQGLRVLDIGCAAGLLSEAIARQGAQVTGIDASTRNIEIARRHAIRNGLGIEYLSTPVESLEVEPFDVVLNMEVVEHVADLPRFMERACALTAPGGHQFLATLNRTPKSFLFAIIGAEYVLRWLPRGTHQWRKFVTPDELSVLLGDHGLLIEDATGVHVNPFTRAYRMGPGLGVNYMMTARRAVS